MQGTPFLKWWNAVVSGPEDPKSVQGYICDVQAFRVAFYRAVNDRQTRLASDPACECKGFHLGRDYCGWKSYGR